jgi:hypothetical protein
MGTRHRKDATKNQDNSMSEKYAIGLDYGTNSVRALVVDTVHGREVGTSVWNYEHGTAGVILGRDPNLARQHPADYVKGAEVTIRQALAAAKKAVKGFRAEQVAGIGVDTTGSTPLPVDDQGQPLAFDPRFAKNPAAMAWLWKDHTGVAEAAEITSPKKSVRNISPSAAASIPANGFSARFSIVCAPRRTFSMPRIRGSSWLITFLPRSPARNIRTGLSRAFAPPGIRRCGTPNGEGIPMRNSWPGSIRSSANSVRASRRAFIRLTAPLADSRPRGRRKPV